MSDPAASAQGRISIADLVQRGKGLSRAEFLERFKNPYLLQLTPSADDKQPGKTRRAAGFATSISDGPLKKRLGVPSAIWAYEIVKRAEANVFGLMITLGRTPNNDLVLPDSTVSKFHLSFSRDSRGGWTIFDASTNGTWVDGMKLPPRESVPVRTGAYINLSQTITMLFLTPEGLQDYLALLETQKKLPG